MELKNDQMDKPKKAKTVDENSLEIIQRDNLNTSALYGNH